jgi:predicted transcriptional regulator
MESVATSVRITATANALLSLLARKTRKPKAQIVEEALRHWEDKMFWAEVQSAFAGTEPDELRAERELWDATVKDGLDEPGAKNEAW